MSKFDPSNLLHVGLSTNDIPTERVLTPEGEHRFVVKKVRIDSGDKDGKTWAKVNLLVALDDQAVLSELGVKELGTSYSFFLDLTEEGMIATGPNQNVRLGQMYQAAGLEGDEVSLSQLEGRQFIGAVRHRIAEKSGTTFDEITAVTALSE